MQFKKNNLHKANSPYLKQHQNNPIHWQEWNSAVLKYAKQNNKPLFVSIGYSTCHWCHIMAEEAFSDEEVANYLNKHFISIKVDREQRPDIDKKMMDFIVHKTGQGGWPLNIFLTSDLDPFYPLTYLPPENFLETLKHIKNYYENNKHKIDKLPIRLFTPTNIDENLIIEIITNNYDYQYGGFGIPKFPTHCTNLFMLHYFEETKNQYLKTMITKMLDAMMENGLMDHLQGGFYRYCTDREWKIPHFEKMLYDQAMHLWVYSLAYKIFKEEKYKIIAEKILKCLTETYLKSGLFISAHDADTNHIEGDTYIWDYNELKEILNENEFNFVKENYYISESGNFEGKIHLIKKTIESPEHPKSSENITEIEEKLLKIRKNKQQPFADEKIITSLNALTGIALINCYRYLEKKEFLVLAEQIFHNLLKKHYINNKLIHSSFKEKIQGHEFLEDYASFLLFITYLHEETNKYKNHMTSFYKKINKFREKNQWIESNNEDFIKVNSDYADHPIPSSASLADLALLRTNILLEKNYLDTKENFKNPLKHDFLNISILIKKGLFHIITSKEKIDWNKLPLNSIQIKGERFSDCYKGSCSFENRYE